MGSSQVTISVTGGPLKGVVRTFQEPRQCVIGRGSDCDVQLLLPDDARFGNVSRHHCELEIDPPTVHVRDLGSRNGTWLNGRKLKHGGVYLENESDRQPGDYVPLGDGDILDIGHNRIKITVSKNKEAFASNFASSQLV
jgi:eukaryotic-like serine/threonine-protein kinase